MQSPFPTPWPNGTRAAVSLTFDDGLPDQLQLGVPRMTDRGLFGTFYLGAGGDHYADRLGPWATALAAGHELGNHTLSHTCSENFSNERRPHGLESLTLDDIEADIVECERRLVALFGPVDGRSFAYPCYMDHVGRGLTRQSYVPVVAKHFVAGRGGGEVGFCNHPYHCDLHAVAGLTCQQMTAPEMIGLCERALHQGRWCVLCFHGLSTGRLGTPLNEFEELLEHLVARCESLWTAPVAVVAKQLAAARAQLGA